MMQFNPMYINVSGNTANITLGNSNKLKNNKYLFADIIKVLMGNIDSGALKKINVKPSGELIKFSELKLIDVKKKTLPENTGVTLFPTMSVLPATMMEKIEKSIAGFSSGLFAQSTEEIHVTSKELRELIGQKLNFKNLKKQLQKGTELQISIENGSEQLNLNVKAENSEKVANYSAGVTLVKDKPAIVNAISGLLEEKVVEPGTKILITGKVNADKNTKASAEHIVPDAKPAKPGKNEVVIKTFVEVKKSIDNSGAPPEVNDKPAKIIVHSPGNATAKVFQINRDNISNILSQLKGKVNNEWKFNKANKIEINKIFNNQNINKVELTKIPQAGKTYKTINGKINANNRNSEIVSDKLIEKTGSVETATISTENNEPFNGKEVFEKEYFIIKEKAGKKTTGENINKFDLSHSRKKAENHKAEKVSSEERNNVRINVKKGKTEFVKINKDKRVGKPELRFVEKSQPVENTNGTSSEQLSGGKPVENKVKSKTLNSNGKNYKLRFQPDNGKVNETEKVKEQNNISKKTQPAKDALNITPDEKSVQNKEKGIQAVRVKSGDEVKHHENIVKSGSIKPEQELTKKENLTRHTVERDQEKIKTEKTINPEKNENQKVKEAAGEESKNVKLPEMPKTEKGKIRRLAKNHDNQPVEKVEIKHKQTQVIQENRQTALVNTEHDTREKQASNNNKSNEKTVDKPAHQAQNISGNENKNKSKDFSNSHNQNTNDIQLKDTVKHHNSKPDFSQVLEKSDLHKPETAQVSQRQESVLKTVKYTELFKEVSRFIQKNEKSFMVLELEPKHLGKVNITLDSSSHSIKAHIQVDNPQTKTLLENNLDELFSNLNKNGIQLGSLDISLNDANRQQNENLKNNKKAGNFNLEDLDTDLNEKPGMKYYGYNTYEYLA